MSRLQVLNLTAALVLLASLPAAATPTATAPDLPLAAPEADRPLGAAEAAASDALGLAETGLAVLAPSGTSRAGEADGVAVAEEGEAAEVLAFAQEAGDLDGDGLADALAYVYTEEEDAGTESLVAISGVTGAPLWRAVSDPEGYTVALRTDVTGDGIDDLMAFAYEGDGAHGPCEGCHPSTEYHYEGTVTWTLRSGVDGAPLWSATFEDTATVVADDDDGEDVHAWAEDHGTRLLGFIDGAVVSATTQSRVESTEQRSTTPVGVAQVEGRRTVEGATTIERRSAADGALESGMSLGSPASSVWASATGDFTGDGTTDLVVRTSGDTADTWSCVDLPVLPDVCSDARDWDTSSAVIVIDVGGMQPRWSIQDDGFGVGARPVGDVDGDGAEDLVLTDFLAVVTDAPAIRVVTGPSGEEIWSRQEGALDEVGQIDGVPTLLLEEQTDDETFVRLDARDGRELFRTTHERPEEANGSSSRGIGRADFDGDGMPDVWLDVSYYSYGADGETPLGGHHFVESGATGEHLFDLDALDDDHWWISPIEDIDGDGGQDLANRYEEGGVEFLSGQDGQPLWASAEDRYVTTAGDMDGHPGAELLTAEGCTVRSLTGTAGALRWSTDLCSGVTG